MTYFLVIVAGIVGLMVALQLVVRLKAKALRGKPLPELSEPWSKRLGGPAARLLYFWSPGCAACRPLTPRFREMSQRRPQSVFVVDVTQELPLARALSVMATPSIVEVAAGMIVGFHVGRAPEELMARYA